MNRRGRAREMFKESQSDGERWWDGKSDASLGEMGEIESKIARY